MVELLMAEAPAIEVRQTIRSFTAFSVERDDTIHHVAFPAGVRIVVIEGPRLPALLEHHPCVAFRPIGAASVYHLPKAEFYGCTTSITSAGA